MHPYRQDICITNIIEWNLRIYRYPLLLANYFVDNFLVIYQRFFKALHELIKIRLYGWVFAR